MSRTLIGVAGGLLGTVAAILLWPTSKADAILSAVISLSFAFEMAQRSRTEIYDLAAGFAILFYATEAFTILYRWISIISL